MNKFGALMIMIALLSLGCGGLGSDTPPPPPKAEKYSVIQSYGPLYTYETRLTNSKNRPVVILLHGAGYEGGVVTNELFDGTKYYSDYTGYFKGQNGYDLADRLYESGYNTIIVDFPGAGANKNYLNMKPGDITLDTWEEALGLVVEGSTVRYDVKPIIIGHSAGAHVGLKYFVKNTDKVDRLVLMAYHPSVKMPDLSQTDINMLLGLTDPCITYSKIRLSGGGPILRYALMFSDEITANTYSSKELIDADLRAENCVPNKVFKGMMSQLLADSTKYDTLTADESGRIYQLISNYDLLYGFDRIKTPWSVANTVISASHSIGFNQQPIRDASTAMILTWLKK